MVVGVAVIHVSFLLTPPPAKADAGLLYSLANSAVWGIIGGLLGSCVGLALGALAGCYRNRRERTPRQFPPGSFGGAPRTVVGERE